MKNKDTQIITRMIEYCNDIEILLIRFNKRYDLYEKDISFQYSCNMCIIQLGELVNRLSPEFLESYNQIPWHAIRAMRNLHAHDYDNIDLDIVWNTLLEDIPKLKTTLQQIL